MNHMNVSFAKSAVRIIAGLLLIYGNFVLAGLFLIGAEGLGIVEELVDKRLEDGQEVYVSTG